MFPITLRYWNALAVPYMLVVVTTPPLMLSVLGARRMVLPLDEVASTSRIRPSLRPVTIWLTVPVVAPPLPLTVSPDARPGRAVVATELRASALWPLAREIAVSDACISDWLCAPRVDTLAVERA